MKAGRAYFIFVSIIMVFLYYCHGDAYLIIWGGIRSEIFFSALVLLIIPVLINKGVFGKLLKNQLLLYFICYFIFMAVWVALSFVPIADITTHYGYIKKQGLNFLILLLCMIWFSRDQNIEITLRYLIPGVVLGVLLNFYDATHIGDYYAMADPYERSTFSMVYARAAGFYLDPNVSAVTLVFGLVLAEPRIKNKRQNLLLILLVGLAVLVTLSLSGVLVYGVFIYRKYFIGKLRLGSVLVIVLSFLVLSFVVRELMQRKVLEFGPGITQRIMAVVDPFGSDDELVSKNSRAILLKNAFDKFTDHPVLGNGLGQHQFIETEQSEETRAGTEAGPHNQWLAFLIDYGILGFFVYSILFLLLLPNKRSLYKKEIYSFLIIYFIYTLFSHTALINHSLMILLPLVYAMGRLKTNSHVRIEE